MESKKLTQSFLHANFDPFCASIRKIYWGSKWPPPPLRRLICYNKQVCRPRVYSAKLIQHVFQELIAGNYVVEILQIQVKRCALRRWRPHLAPLHPPPLVSRKEAVGKLFGSLIFAFLQGCKSLFSNYSMMTVIRVLPVQRFR